MARCGVGSSALVVVYCGEEEFCSSVVSSGRSVVVYGSEEWLPNSDGRCGELHS